jgi:hypothetical protein
MQILFLCVLLGGGAAPAASAAEALPFADGTLVFLESASSVVEYSTRGKIGHVALAFRDGGQTWIYEATPAKVRRVAAAEYCAELARLNARRDADEKIRAWLLRPKPAYRPEEVARMREFLDAQVGRRYSVENYVKGRPGEGIHCAELASTTLARSGRYAFEQFHRIHPQALYTAALATHEPPVELAIALPAVQEAWCARAQRRWSEYWNWCRWGCGEAWAFCW